MYYNTPQNRVKHTGTGIINKTLFKTGLILNLVKLIYFEYY